MKYQEIEEDLIELAFAGSFDVIAHGCNCFCTQGKGIALQMRKAFATTNPFNYPLENIDLSGDINKLGNIQFREYYVGTGGRNVVAVVNAYTQYEPGPNLDYNALTLCLRKINNKFKGKHIGLPLIGCGIAGGVWDVSLLPKNEQITALPIGVVKDVKTIIQEELKDMDVTIVHYKK